eukprot:13137260-Alexandrium_andersonii.AAC.1
MAIRRLSYSLMWLESQGDPRDCSGFAVHGPVRSMDVRSVSALQGNQGDLLSVRDSKTVCSCRSSRHSASGKLVGVQRSVA